MLSHQIYYRMKPFIPRAIRLSVRRIFARRLQKRVQDVWPILPGSDVPPANWPGWPDGKKFALVLTHDVEGPKGRDRCLQLMELEARLGFKSSFNFIPESDYAVPQELRDRLAGNGFEVGVHDLKHDGKLYFSHEAFRANAGKINQYLKDWNAVGFRSGFMHHNLEWLADLNVQYDASTFDTDPFEPQPDGAGTIFPFWVQRKNGTGYLEMPYTLVQDFVLFVVLREQTIDIWKRKLDWIASRGGMALLNVHPDYTCFNDGPLALDEFRVGLYREFLEWVKQKYAGQYFHALPAEVARWAAAAKPARVPARAGKRICMLSASIYEVDNRVMRYAQTLVQRGDSVDALAMSKHPSSPRCEVMNGVRIIRLQRKPMSPGKIGHLYSAVRFLVSASLVLTRNHLRRRYDLIHVHNMPDFLVFAAWFPKLTGAAVILDIHDIFPEFYASKFKASNASRAVGVLRQCERLSAAFADHVILSNHLWERTYSSRAASPDKCSVFINSVDPALFRPQERRRQDGKLIVIYPGSFNRHQGLDLAIQALAKVKDTIPQIELHLYGDGPEQPELMRLAQELSLNGHVRFFNRMPLPQIPAVLAEADLGVVPKRASDFFGNEAFSTKIMEFMSQGLPAIVSRTRVDTFYYTDNDVRFFESDNADDLARALEELGKNRDLRERLSQAGRDFVVRNSWATQKKRYLDLVDSLITR